MGIEACTILHVDMDAFFAAIELHDHPELRGRPVIVGSAPDARGVVCTASYEARKYGVHSAMPSRTAYRLCPHGVFLPVRKERYADISRQVMAVFRSVTPMVEQISIDEAFLDVAGILRRFGNPVVVAQHIRALLRSELQLTGSVGVAPNKFLAKLASDMRKPDGLTITPSDPQEILEFLAPLSVSKIWGVGKVTAEHLASKRIRTIGEIQALTRNEAAALLGGGHGRQIWRLSQGLDNRKVDPAPRIEKSISHEDTFPHDISDPKIVRQTLIKLTEKVGRRLRKSGMFATVGQLKLRYGDFTTITRQRRFAPITCHDRDLLRCACGLLEAENVSRPVRLIGFGVSDLRATAAEDEHGQLLLFDETATEEGRRERALDHVVDSLREQLGHDIIRRGDW
ncbi:MAG: DNA polymerase IV [Lentisphaeria bacterium]|nr:DNA polymerase IV [Lentisphaeria bacterium]